jgi:hypothetical protein
MRLRPFRRSTLLKWCTWRWCDAAQLLSFLEEVERRSHARSMHGRRGTAVCDRRSFPLTPGHSPSLPGWGCSLLGHGGEGWLLPKY